MTGEIALVLVRLNDVTDPEDVNVVSVPAGKSAGGALAADFAQRVRVHGVDVVVFLEGEGVVVCIALREADAVGGFGACSYDFADAEFRGRFDDVVGGCDVCFKAFVVWDNHVARVGCEVDYHVWRRFGGAVGVACLVVVGGEGVEDLAAVG